MATVISKPTTIQAAGQPPKLIEEFIGRVNSNTTAVGIARMKSPSGWSEPGQKPEFDEYTVVLRGSLHLVLVLATVLLGASAVLAQTGTTPAERPLIKRIQSRTFPSVFQAWNPAQNVHDQSPLHTELQRLRAELQVPADDPPGSVPPSRGAVKPKPKAKAVLRPGT